MRALFVCLCVCLRIVRVCRLKERERARRKRRGERRDREREARGRRRRRRRRRGCRQEREGGRRQVSCGSGSAVVTAQRVRKSGLCPSEWILV